MYCPTADDFSSIRFRDGPERIVTTRDAEKIERHVKWNWKFEMQPSDVVPEAQYHIATFVAPSWLESTKKHIRESIAPFGQEISDDGRWLRQESASTAIDFFEAVGDLLPGNPYLYGSTKGDVVAEFEGDSYSLTVVITTDFALMFAVQDGAPIEKKIEFMLDYRKELERFSQRLSVGRYGSTLEAAD